MPPLRLSDDELDAVMLAARPLRPHDRDAFLQEVANALAGCSEIGPGTVPWLVARRSASFSIRPSSRTTSANIAEHHCRSGQGAGYNTQL